MSNPSSNSGSAARKAHGAAQLTVDHYLRLVWHRKWLVLGTFALVTSITCVVVYRMPDIYTSETVILVDPQKVPETYVKSTVTGDVKNRLGTLSQQILSTTRLQKIIDTLNLYPAERKTMAREDVVGKMRHDISVSIRSDFSGSQDLQAFSIKYSGRDPRLTAQVCNDLATQFIDENLKARESLATGTSDFIANQLQEARKALDEQESKLRDFRMKHLGEMPEQETADLQILGQLQSQLQLEDEALARAEQQRTTLQAMMNSVAPVVEEDDPKPATPVTAEGKPVAAASPATKLTSLKAQLNSLLALGRTDQHPDVRRLRGEIAAEEVKEAAASGASASAPPAAAASTAAAATPGGSAGTTTAKGEVPPVPQAPRPKRTPPPNYTNPVLVAQLRALDAEAAKHKQERDRLKGLVAGYQRKLETIPVNQQAISAVVRDYDISKAHYQQLLNEQLSAETATQLEIRQKGEKFLPLDLAQPAERPSEPKRMLLDSGGAIAGLALGLLLALFSEFLGVSITSPEQVASIAGLPVLEVIPVIETRVERRVRRKRLILATLSAALLTLVGSGAYFFVYRLRM